MIVRKADTVSLIFFFFFIFIICWEVVSSCSPGRGGIRRRGARKLIPLVYKQHVPNFSERSLAASGLPKGVIDRQSELFHKLVVNYNPDIIFKDEEGTGADRLMTERCKEKLNTLAISVMNHWPGVYLRVTEAWDEDLLHAPESLHYEGRAVDLTTSDRDKRKYGMLARLAVESGFDWVYYESRSHIHASCKSESQHPSKSGGCFHGSSTVMLSDGRRKKLLDIDVGDEVLAVDPSSGQFTFSPVILFLDRSVNERRQFVTIETESGESITLTPMHLIYRGMERSRPLLNSSEEFVDFEAVFAGDVREDDVLLVQGHGASSASGLMTSRVVSIRVEVHKGVYAPLTSTGNLVVEGVVASCYAVVDSQALAHVAFAPIRWYHGLKSWLSFAQGAPDKNNMSKLQGVHWYADALYSFAQYIVPNHLR